MILNRINTEKQERFRFICLKKSSDKLKTKDLIFSTGNRFANTRSSKSTNQFQSVHINSQQAQSD